LQFISRFVVSAGFALFLSGDAIPPVQMVTGVCVLPNGDLFIAMPNHPNTWIIIDPNSVNMSTIESDLQYVGFDTSNGINPCE
jgi:hypothetical protein